MQLSSSGSPVRLSARQSLSQASSMRCLSQASSVLSLDGAGKAMTMTATAAAVEARSIPSQAREYVESLHQNQRDVLLFGEEELMFGIYERKKHYSVHSKIQQ